MDVQESESMPRLERLLSAARQRQESAAWPSPAPFAILQSLSHAVRAAVGVHSRTQLHTKRAPAPRIAPPSSQPPARLRLNFEMDRQRLCVASVPELDGLLLLLHDAVAVLKGYRNSHRLRLGERVGGHFQRDVLLHFAAAEQRIEWRDFFLHLLRGGLRRFLSQRLELRHDVD